MGLKATLAGWLRLEPVGPIDDRLLDAIHQRRFPGADRERFGRLWCEVARLMRVSPSTLSEDDNLRELASSVSKFPYTVLDELADFAYEESTNVPDLEVRTIGELLDWLLAR